RDASKRCLFGDVFPQKPSSSLACSGTLISSSCASCERVQEEEGGALLEAVKRHILARLHLRARPNITHSLPRAAVLPALRRLHAAVRQDGGVELPPERRAEDSSEIISFAEKDDMSSSPSALFFLVSNEGNRTLQVSGASLWLPRRVLLKLYHQEAPGFGGEWRLTERRLQLRRSGWRRVDLMGALRRLFQSGRRRQNVDVRCDGCDEERVEPVLLEPSDASHRPFIAVQASLPDSRGRSRRGLECDGEGGLCCRRQFYIDFRLIGWSDWIIAPSGYYANYCEGRCPGNMAAVPSAVSSFHTAIINQYRLRGLAPSSASCCIPTRLSAMSMLYFDDQYNIVKRDVPSMIVEECGCA
uniref:TGF-beta family profile domain-containing protein n=1 Tax=Neogobius melanostomus TaxID=47308 RepID=A0A8C6UEN9_9GOBI